MSRHKFPEIVVKIRITEPLMGHPTLQRLMGALESTRPAVRVAPLHYKPSW